MSDKVLVRGGYVISMDPEIKDLDNADVLVVDGKIEAVGRDLAVDDAEVIDAAGAVVLPGFVDSHRHLWQSPIRMIAGDWTFGQYLTGIGAGLTMYYEPEDSYVANLVGTLEALDAGVTTVLDWNQNVETPEHSDAAIRALQESGARAVFGHSGGASMYQLPSEVPHDRDILRIQKQYFNSDDQLVTLVFAARGPEFSTRETAKSDWALADELGTRISIHVGCGEWGKNRPVAWLHEQGLTSDKITYIHCNTLADDELQIIADTGGTASVSADIETQMGHGWPCTGRLLDHGVRPSLSIDVCSSTGGDMFGAMKTTIAVQRALDNAAEERPGEQERVRLSCRDVLEFATIEGARACGLSNKTGSLRVGKRADLVVLRDPGLAFTPLNHPTASLVYAGHPGMVDTVLVDGKIVKRDGTLTGVDLPRVRRQAEEARDRILARAVREGGVLGQARSDGSWIPETKYA